MRVKELQVIFVAIVGLFVLCQCELLEQVAGDDEEEVVDESEQPEEDGDTENTVDNEDGAATPNGGVIAGRAAVRIPKGMSFRDIYVPDVQLTLNQDDGNGGMTQIAQTESDINGNFDFGFMQPGEYQMCWTVPGTPAHCAPNMIEVTDAPALFYPRIIELSRPSADGIFYGTVQHANGPSCYFSKQYFGVKRTATVHATDSQANDISHTVRANTQGEYVLAGVPMGDVTIHGECGDSSEVELTFTQANVNWGLENAADLTLTNNAPKIRGLNASYNGSVKTRVAPGTTVKVEATVEDANDVLDYSWKLSGKQGSLSTSSSNTVDWTVPQNPGTYSLHLLVEDASGFFAHRRISMQVGSTATRFSGTVVDMFDLPVEGVSVTVNVDSGAEAKTDANGEFSLKTDVDGPYVVNFARLGFQPTSHVYESSINGHTWRLEPAYVHLFDPTQTTNIVEQFPQMEGEPTRSGAEITVLADTLVDADGNLPAGNVEAHIRSFDPTKAPLPFGNYGARNADGENVSLRSYGAVFVEFIDVNTMGDLQLRDGATALVEFPVPQAILDSGNAPTEVPVWYYDDTSGLWVEEENATAKLVGNLFEYDAKHFSELNFDLAFTDAVCIKLNVDPDSFTLPMELDIEVPFNDGVQHYSLVVQDEVNALKRLPANTNIIIRTMTEDYGEYVLMQINTGNATLADGGYTAVSPYDECELNVDLGYADDRFLVRDGPQDPQGNPTPEEIVEYYEAQAEAYYEVIGAGEGTARRTLGGWWAENGYDPDNGDPAGPADNPDNNGTRAVYQNLNDLNFGRNMNCRTEPHLSCWVTNYTNVDFAATALTGTGELDDGYPGETVTMEYSQVDGAGDPIVKFFIYDAAGDAATEIVTHVNLDTLGPKFMPGICMNCHGGNYNPQDLLNPTVEEAGGKNPNDPTNLGAQFIPWDTVVYGFPASMPLADQKDEIKTLNDMIVSEIDPDALYPALSEMIAGWYPNGQLQNNDSGQDNGWIPPDGDWNTPEQQTLYLDVIVQSCRMCHTTQNYTTFTNSGELGMLQYYGCVASGDMPHAKITYNRFHMFELPAVISANDGPNTPCDTFADNAEDN